VTLRLILGDQLNASHSWFRTVSDDVTYVLMEVRQETDYVKHHVQKVVGFFAAMRRFADHLRQRGHRVVYIKLGDRGNRQDFNANIKGLIRKLNVDRFQYQLPDDYRLDRQLSAFAESLDRPAEAVDTEHFLTARDEVGAFFKGRKQYVMESFYRHMRRTHVLLVADGEPCGGKWNFDVQNRKKWTGSPPAPDPLHFDNDCSDILADARRAGVDTFGQIDASRFPWPIDREQALALLDHFVNRCLQHFGTYEDAMHTDHEVLFHSRLSFALNTKMLGPMEVVDRAIDAWRKRPDDISMPQIEGFVRQIIGWREFMRGIYWAFMPGYEQRNHFGHSRQLPGWYWTGDTRMNCLRHAVGQSLRSAYAHHIQRLMVIGNFALLAGVDPDEVDAWYLGVYIDAVQWVEITNTRGMSQFADGGIVATKPYIASANYVSKMSNYCKGCPYDHRRRYGEAACPFNSLYWRFVEVNRDKLEGNFRMKMVYRTWEKMDRQERRSVLNQAEAYLDRIEEL
jgi:deoxyribodipyrimidine photolyase-related protein